MINFEQELVAKFSVEHSLADQLRFPLFVESITAPERKDTIKDARALRAAQTILARFDADLDPEVLDDQRYDFRIRLVPMLGPKSEADAAIEFVKLDELTDDERKVMTEAGRSGRVITKVKKVSVSSAGCMLPGRVVSEVQKQVPFEFNMSLHTRLWQHFKLRPASWVPPDGGDTVPEFCIPDEPTRQYVYTPAWIDKIVKEIGTPEKFEAFFGAPPRKGKVTPIEACVRHNSGCLEVPAALERRSADRHQLASAKLPRDADSAGLAGTWQLARYHLAISTRGMVATA